MAAYRPANDTLSVPSRSDICHGPLMGHMYIQLEIDSDPVRDGHMYSDLCILLSRTRCLSLNRGVNHASYNVFVYCVRRNMSACNCCSCW